MLCVRYIKLVGLTLLLLFLSSCSYVYKTGMIQDRDTDYLKARTTPPLYIPPGLSSSTIEGHYPIPEREFQGPAQRVDLKPPGL